MPTKVAIVTTGGTEDPLATHHKRMLERRHQARSGEETFQAAIFKSTAAAIGYLDEPNGILLFIHDADLPQAQQIAAERSDIRIRLFGTSSTVGEWGPLKVSFKDAEEGQAGIFKNIV